MSFKFKHILILILSLFFFFSLIGPASAMKPYKTNPLPAKPQNEATKPAAETKTETKEKPFTLYEALEDRQLAPKRFQSEFNVFGGNYLGDEWYNTWDVGGRYFFHINNTFAVGAEYFYSPIRADSSGNFGESLTTKKTHTLTSQLMISNDAAFRSGNTILECDLFLALGAGSMQINKKWKPVGVIGGGIKVYPNLPWFAIRFDVNSYLHSTPKPGGDTFNADVAIDGGISFFFPTIKKEAPKDNPEEINPPEKN